MLATCDILSITSVEIAKKVWEVADAERRPDGQLEREILPHSLRNLVP